MKVTLNNHPNMTFSVQNFFFFCRLTYRSQMELSNQMPLKNYFCVVQAAMQQPTLSCSSITYKATSHISVSTVNSALKDHTHKWNTCHESDIWNFDIFCCFIRTDCDA